MASVAAVFRRKKAAGPADADERALPQGPKAPPPPTDENRPTLARKLPGATVLQIMPALRDEPAVRAALNITGALLRSGTRVIVAADRGALVSEVQSLGAEWLRLRNTATSGWLLRRNVRRLEDLIVVEHIDIIHAHGAGAALAARAAALHHPVWLITNLPDGPIDAAQIGKKPIAALMYGHRIFAHSAYVAIPIEDHYRLPPDRIAVVPPAIDTAAYHPNNVNVDTVATLRKAWNIQPDEFVVLAPGALTPEAGHALLVDAARILYNRGIDGLVFVVPGVRRSGRRDFSAITKHAKAQRVDELFCLGTPAADEAALLAAADVVVIPALAPSTDGSLAGKAQAMAKPVIASAIGALPEYVLAPPRMPDDLRTGWLIRPNDPIDLARAIGEVLTLNDRARHAMGVRAWQFAQSSFSANGVAADTLAVYTSLLDNVS